MWKRVLQSRLIRGFTLHSVLMTVPLRHSKTGSNYIVAKVNIMAVGFAIYDDDVFGSAVYFDDIRLLMGLYRE